MIVHLLGWPGVGKLSVARALALDSVGSESPFLVVDNHLTSRPILEVVNADGVIGLPAAVWGYVGEIREIVYEAIEQLAPPNFSFVFTNVMVESHRPASMGVIERLTQLAHARNTRYVPILLTASPEQLATRVASPSRSVERKWIDAEAVREFTINEQLVEPDGVIRVDTTELTADQTAKAVRKVLADRHGDDTSSIAPTV